MSRLDNKTVVIGVTGGIAAYKACDIASALKKHGASVHIILTKNATEFVSPLTFETISQNRVIVDMFSRDFEYNVQHISLAKKADVFLVAPATANFVAKFAGGVADDFLTTTALAVKCPIFIAPAMNTAMLTSGSYIQNKQTLIDRGVKFIETASGRLACGDEGDGKLADVNDIVNTIVKLLSPLQDYDNKTLLITAGATLEPLDPVRFITNYSSGKMGAQLANAAVSRGAKVIFIHGNLSVNMPLGVTSIAVKTTQQMYDAVLENLPKADIIIKAAAPSDYRVKKISEQKIKLSKLKLNLVKNVDIAKAVGKIKQNKKLVIFCAETENLVENAQKKLKLKNADLAVANDVTQSGAGFNVDTNIATLVTKTQTTPLTIMTKLELANVILDKLL